LVPVSNAIVGIDLAGRAANSCSTAASASVRSAIRAAAGRRRPRLRHPDRGTTVVGGSLA
jgi:hypothetical protein